MNLEGSSALVTGGHRRIGLAIARRLAAAGCNLHLTYNRSAGDANAAKTELEGLGVEVTLHAVDLANDGAVAALAAKLEDIDILINNAAVFPRTPLDTLSLDTWRHCLDVNLTAPFQLATVLGQRMQTRGHGAIVNLIDWAVDRPYRDHLPYFVSKAGLQAMTRALAVELAPEVRVNGIAPGPIALPEDTTPAQREHILSRTPMGREGGEAAVAKTIIYLLDETTFTAGSIVYVDGGRSLET